jgi:hypothetical protein
VVTAFPQLPILNILMCPYEDRAILERIYGAPLLSRKSIVGSTPKKYMSHTYTNASDIVKMYAPLKGSPSGIDRSQGTYFGGPTMRIARTFKDEYDSKALVEGNAYADVEAISNALKKIIQDDKQTIEVEQEAKEYCPTLANGGVTWTVGDVTVLRVREWVHGPGSNGSNGIPLPSTWP